MKNEHKYLTIIPVVNGYIVKVNATISHRNDGYEAEVQHVFNTPRALADFIDKFYSGEAT